MTCVLCGCRGVMGRFRGSSIICPPPRGGASPGQGAQIGQRQAVIFLGFTVPLNNPVCRHAEEEEKEEGRIVS